MKTALLDHEVKGKERTEQAREKETVNDHVISQLFRAYFNNKMTLLIFLIQAKTMKPSPHLLEEISRFLEDLFHHMLDHETQGRYQHAFEWLNIFFRELPEVSQAQRSRAIGLIRDLYQVMGINLKTGILSPGVTQGVP